MVGERQPGHKRYFLLPSTLRVSTVPCTLETVLGSCVAICLYDVKKQYGGMNHFLLPVWDNKGHATAKYGNIATTRLIERMLALGSDKNNLVAKVFGGATDIIRYNMYKVGTQNIELAIQLLEHHRIPILTSDTGGSKGRKVLMNTANNKVYLKYF